MIKMSPMREDDKNRHNEAVKSQLLEKALVFVVSYSRASNQNFASLSVFLENIVTILLTPKR